MPYFVCYFKAENAGFYSTEFAKLIRRCCLRLRNIVVQPFFLMGHLGLRGSVMNLLSFNPLIPLVLNTLHPRFLSLFHDSCEFV